MDSLFSEPQLPRSNNPATQKLAQVFRNVSASYKYFWFLGLLEAVQYRPYKRKKIPIKELFAEMVGHAWYTVHYFKLSFGPWDSLEKAIDEIHSKDPNRYPISLSKKLLCEKLVKDDRIFIINALNQFQKQVPFRFLTPWLGSQHSNKEIFSLSQGFNHGCPYRLVHNPDGKFIEVNPSWIAFLMDYNQILKDFCYWHLALFIQKRNPSVPAIIHKLKRPEKRSSLISQRKFWQVVLEQEKQWNCIFSNTPISPHQFDLDHFIPWSFVAHDHLWNLVPIQKHVNHSKSDKLPDLSFYLSKFVSTQQKALRFLQSYSGSARLISDFTQVSDIETLLKMDQKEAEKAYYRILNPLIEIAGNMGYQQNWVYQTD